MSPSSGTEAANWFKNSMPWFGAMSLFPDSTRAVSWRDGYGMGCRAKSSHATSGTLMPTALL
jgi:hypothetical protein